ncbi:hypothetical protein KFL_000780320 [Klebsormidium nitens]|uniref:Inner centromere protein ARK-binding domain-containing protein n=1 Tax=Klebsormidium nitens TaxID=105231 RepID=A0A1Y1HRW4_KLENI|nr:hypothetical protein KFL_000780320 [Klebsormidium nitens]|eukprot:GAQ81370.1 hypothetical protein KFL_000780320 [Klebsormidium nitens]
MAAEFEQLLADLRTLVDEKLGEIEHAHHGHARWLEDKGRKFLRAIDMVAQGSKDGGFKVPQSRKPKQGARGPNDENIPPGQHAFAAQTPAAVKKARGLAEEATPALRVSSRQRQKVLRDVPPSNKLSSATPAPQSAAQPSTRSSSRQPTEDLTPARDDRTTTQAVPENVPASVPAVDTAVPKERAEESAPAAAAETVAAESVKRSSGADADRSDKVEVQKEDTGEGEAEAAGREEAAEVAETERVVYTRRAKQAAAGQVRSEEKNEEKSLRKRKGKRGAEEAVADEQKGSAEKEAPAGVMQAAADVAETPAEAKETRARGSGGSKKRKEKTGLDEAVVSQEDGPVDSPKEPAEVKDLPADVSRTPAGGKELPADVSQVLRDQQDLLPPGEAPLVNAAVEHGGPVEGPNVATEVVKEPEAETGAKRRGKKEAVDDAATRGAEADLKQTASETVPAGGRMTRRRAKELGVDFEALPSGLVDGSEVKAGKKGRQTRKNRRKELDEGAIRQQALEKELEAAGAQVEAAADAKKPAEARENGAGGETTPAKPSGGDAKEGTADEMVSAEEGSGKQVDKATVPETPEEGPPVRRSQREKRANEEAPAGRVTRGRAAKGTPLTAATEAETVAEASAEKAPEAAADAEEGGLGEDQAEPPLVDGSPVVKEGVDGATLQESEAVPESEDEALATKKKRGKKKGRGRQKKTPPALRASEDGEREAGKETAGEKELSHEEEHGREEATVLELGGANTNAERQPKGNDGSEQEGAVEGVVSGLVSNPAEPASTTPEATHEAPTPTTGPSETVATPVEIDAAPVLELGSPKPPTPGPRLTRSGSKAGDSSRENGGSSAFGSPVPTAPESALRGTQSGALASPGRVLRSASKSPGSPSAVDNAQNPVPSALTPVPSTLTPDPSALNLTPSALNPAPSSLDPSPVSLGRATRAASNAQITPGTVPQAEEEHVPAVASPSSSSAEERSDRRTRSGSRARKETGETSPPAVLPAQDSADAALSPDSPAQKSASLSPVSPPPDPATDGNQVPSISEDANTAEAPQPSVFSPVIVTRSASQARTPPEQTKTPVFSSADIAPGSGSRKRSRGEGDVSDQPTPEGLARVSGEKGTPGVLTRSQSKLRGSADVTPGWNGSPEILEGDLSGVLVSPKSPSSDEAAKLTGASVQFPALPKQSPKESPIQMRKTETEPQTRAPVASPPVSARAFEAEKKETVAPSPRQDASPSVDMDVCTTPLTAGPHKAPRPVTGKRNAQGVSKGLVRSEGAGITSAVKADDVRSPLRRSPRFQGDRMTSAAGVTSAAKQTGVRSSPLGGGSSVRKSERIQDRSAKKMRLSGGFALAGLGGELIDLENEDEDLMEPNFEINSEGLRRSARKTADGAKESPGTVGKNRLSFSGAAGLSADVRNMSPGGKAPESGGKSFRFSAHKSTRKSARKRSAGGRPSFVSASDDGSGEFAAAGFGGLAAEASAGNLDAFAAGAKSAQKKTPAKRGNLIANGITSLLSFMTKKEPTGPPIPGNNKNTVKGSVKALEAAEAARREEARRAEEREKRKALTEKRREEKLREAAAGAAQAQPPPAKPADAAPAPERRTVPGAAAVSATVIDQKLRRANEFRSRIEDQKARRLEEDLRKKEEERRKKEQDAVRKKRQREEDEKKEKEEKRRRLEDAHKMKKDAEERQRAELEEKERKRKQQEEAERKQKATEEEERRRRRKEKELEAERRRKEEEEKRVAKLKEREEDRKRQEGLFIRRKEDERNEKMLRPNGPKPLTPIKTYLAENAASARHSPLVGTDKMMPPPRTTPSRHANADAAAQNQYLSANTASRNLNPASGYASSSLVAKPSGLQFPKPAANPPTNLRVTGWEDRAAKAKLAAPGSSSQKDSAPHFGKGGGGSVSGGENLRSRTPPPAEAVESYEISPFKEESSDEEEEENESEAKKPIPAWARKENLGPALRRQMGIDPDEVFQNMSVKTCSLDQVFGTKGSKKKKDFGRRSSSGNWLEDRLTWKEELQYKKGMGYL